MEFEGLTFTPLTAEDIPVLTPIMKRSFDEDSRLHSDQPEGGPDGYDDGSFLRKWGLSKNATAFRIDLNGAPVGAMILFIKAAQGVGFLGNIFIDSDKCGKGLGSIAWRFAEHSFPQVRVWRTETPAVSYRNHVFYVNKCGFQVVHVEGGRDRFDAQFQLQKTLPDRAEK